MLAAATRLAEFCIARGDDALVLGHRLSEWTGRAPMLEEELALANIGLDLIGQARALYSYACELRGKGDEDQLAYFRDARAFRNLLLVEQPNGDFAHTIARQVFYSAYADPWWRGMMASSDATLAAVGARSEKESAYHLRHASEWLIRLGDGTPESHRRAQAAVDALWPYVGEMFDPDHLPGVAIDQQRAAWDASIDAILGRATLIRPADGFAQRGGRAGRHGEGLGVMLAEMQSLARAHPGATW